LKTKVLTRFLMPLMAFFLLSFSDPYTIKRISDANFRYEFYTLEKEIKPNANKTYYWFKGGAIHHAQSGVGGSLLNDSFVKMYLSNQLAEQGQFKKGLKEGLWKTWFANGKLQTVEKWNKGLKTGNYLRYDENGILLEKGNYKNDKKQNKWIDYVKKDTLVYKKGIVVVKKQKLSELDQYKLNVEKTKIEQSKKELKEAKKLKESTTLATYKATDKENEKILKEREKAEKQAKKPQMISKEDSKLKAFFKNLFKKKQPKQNNNG
jgi:MORN repeat variant